MADEARVLIQHKEDRRQFSVTPQDFKRVKHDDGRTYQEQGFEIVSWETGEPYKEGQSFEATVKALVQQREHEERARLAELEKQREASAQEEAQALAADPRTGATKA